MKICLNLALLGLAAAAGCTHPPGGSVGQPVAPLGIPKATVDASVLGRGPAPAQADNTSEPVRLPDRITLPANYRLVLLDGHLSLIRETDSQALEGAPTSLRIVAGELSRGELGYQPGLLPQELAAEVAANRESSARMDNALWSVLQKSRELAQQAKQLQEQSQRISEALERAEGKIARLEEAARAAGLHPEGPSAPQGPASP